MAASMNALGDKIAQGITASFAQFFAPGSLKKVRKEDGTEVQEAASPKRKHGAMPFQQEQGEWLQHALTETMKTSFQTFGEHINAQVKHVEQKADNAEAMAKQAQEKTVEMQKVIDGLKAEVDAFRAKIDSAVLSPASPAPQPPASSPRSSEASSGSASASASGRRLAYVGCLGWDTPEQVLKERWQLLKTEAGIPQEEIEAEAPIVSKKRCGSAFEVLFRAPSNLSANRLRVKGLAKVFEGDKVAFLDFKKDEEELKPGRALQKASLALKQFEEEKPAAERQQFVVRPYSRELLMGGERVAVYLRTGIKWAKKAIDHFPPSVLKAAEEEAEL